MGIAYNSSIVRDGLVLHLDAANQKSYPGSGTTWSDLSGNGNNGTLVNGVAYSSDNNGNMVFDGVNDYVSLPSITLTAWTIGYWFYHDTTSSFDMTIGQRGQNANRFYHRDTGTSDYRLRVHNSSEINVQDMIIGSDGWQSWHQLFYSMDGNGSVKGWVDGEIALDTTTANDSEFIIDSIGDVYTSGFIWLGSLNNIMVYNRQVTSEEIRQNFESTRGRYGI